MTQIKSGGPWTAPVPDLKLGFRLGLGWFSHATYCFALGPSVQLGAGTGIRPHERIVFRRGLPGSFCIRVVARAVGCAVGCAGADSCRVPGRDVLVDPSRLIEHGARVRCRRKLSTRRSARSITRQGCSTCLRTAAEVRLDGGTLQTASRQSRLRTCVVVTAATCRCCRRH